MSIAMEENVYVEIYVCVLLMPTWSKEWWWCDSMIVLMYYALLSVQLNSKKMYLNTRIYNNNPKISLYARICRIYCVLTWKFQLRAPPLISMCICTCTTKVKKMLLTCFCFHTILIQWFAFKRIWSVFINIFIARFHLILHGFFGFGVYSWNEFNFFSMKIDRTSLINWGWKLKLFKASCGTLNCDRLQENFNFCSGVMYIKNLTTKSVYMNFTNMCALWYKIYIGKTRIFTV